MGLLELFTATSLALGIPPGLLEAVCKVESNHNIKAVHYSDGNGTSVGICQIKTATANMVGIKTTEKELYYPAINIKAAGTYLKYGYETCGTWNRAIYFYNSGHCPKTDRIIGYRRKVFNAWDNEEKVRTPGDRKTITNIQ